MTYVAMHKQDDHKRQKKKFFYIYFFILFKNRPTIVVVCINFFKLVSHRLRGKSGTQKQKKK